MHDITVSNTDNHIVKAIKPSVLADALPENNRLGRNRLGGVYIEDMYLYRIDKTLLEDNIPDSTMKTIA